MLHIEANTIVTPVSQIDGLTIKAKTANWNGVIMFISFHAVTKYGSFFDYLVFLSCPSTLLHD